MECSISAGEMSGNRFISFVSYFPSCGSQCCRPSISDSFSVSKSDSDMLEEAVVKSDRHVVNYGWVVVESSQKVVNSRGESRPLFREPLIAAMS